MMLFDKDSAGNLRPKPWTSPQPPLPFDRTLFSWQTVATLTIVFVGTVMAILGAPAVLAALVIAIGAGWGLTYTAVQIRRSWHEMRWLNSSHDSRPLDDEGLL